jgi:hypothetical protein
VATATERFADMAPSYSARFAAYCAYRREALAASDPRASERYTVALGAELDVLEG